LSQICDDSPRPETAHFVDAVHWPKEPLPRARVGPTLSAGEKSALIPGLRSFPFRLGSDLVIDHLFRDSFCTTTVALTGETISTLPNMYHEISVALPVSGWTRTRAESPR